MCSGRVGEQLWDGSEPPDLAAKPPLGAGEGHFPCTSVDFALAKHKEEVCRGIAVCQVISQAKAP